MYSGVGFAGAEHVSSTKLEVWHVDWLYIFYIPSLSTYPEVMSWPVRDQASPQISQGQYKTLPSFTEQLSFTHRLPRDQEDPLKKLQNQHRWIHEVSLYLPNKAPKETKGDG